jgi:hypothetical protein
LRRGRRGRCQVTRWPGGLVRCWPAGGDAWDAASQAAANLWWVHLVLSLFQVADPQLSPLDRVHSASRADVLSVPGAVRAPPIDQGGHSSRTTISTPTRRIQKRRRLGRDVLCFGGRRRFCGSSILRSAFAVKYPFLLLPKPTSCNRRRNKNASGASLREREPLATATCGRMGNQNRPAIPLSRRSTRRIVTDKA